MSVHHGVSRARSLRNEEMMFHSELAELRRRTILKSIIWRLIGIIWTWIGAYFIILIVPPTRENAAIVAALIVFYHHSTRMIMYYVYERMWVAVSWGKHDLREGGFRPMSLRDKIIWTTGTLVGIGVVFFLIGYVAPLITEHKG